MGKEMTVEEAAKELDRQVKRFAADRGGRGGLLAKSAREYYKTILDCRKKIAEGARSYDASKKLLDTLLAEVAKKEAQVKKLHDEVAQLKSRIITHRKVVRNGDILAKREHIAQIRFVEKVQVLRTMKDA